MPARLVQVTVKNHSTFPILWKDDGRKWGDWQDPWYPSKLQTLMPGSEGAFRMESDGVMTGLAGWAYFMIDTPSIGDDPGTEYFTLSWERPFYGEFGREIHHVNTNPDRQVAVGFKEGFGDYGVGSSVGEGALAVAIPFSAPFVAAGMLSEVAGNHVSWTVEVVNNGLSQAIPGQATSGLVADQKFSAVAYIDSTLERVWRALVTPELTAKYWHGIRIESAWSVGSQVRFVPERGDRHSECGTVLEYSELKRLVYTIKTDPCEDCQESRIAFTLEPVDRRVKLTLIHDRLPKGRGARAVHDLWSSILASFATVVDMHTTSSAFPGNRR